MPVTKERFFQKIVHQPPHLVQPDGSSSVQPAPTVTELRQVTVSDGHPYFFAVKRKGFTGRDVGGPFSTRTYKWEPGFPGYGRAQSSVVGGHYQNGNLHTVIPSTALFTSLFNAVPEVSVSTLNNWGTTAVNNTIPTKSGVELATSAAELIGGGLPKILGAGLLKSVIKDHRKVGSHAKAGADELLNYEFGIKPLIGDLKDTAKSIVGAAERLQQLERDSGKLVRRKFRFPDRAETFQTTKTGAYPPGWGYTYLWSGNTPRGVHQQWTTYKTSRWFSGAFTYHLNIGERHRNQLYAAADNARLLLGIKLDAEVLWNLAPWSWLADWFGNTGDIVSNMSNFSRDGLVMPYGYIMAESSVHVHSRMSGLNWWNSSNPTTINDEYGFVRKQRQWANPFGFGLTDAMLDSRQLSILSALGISKMPTK